MVHALLRDALREHFLRQAAQKLQCQPWIWLTKLSKMKNATRNTKQNTWKTKKRNTKHEEIKLETRNTKKTKHETRKSKPATNRKISEKIHFEIGNLTYFSFRSDENCRWLWFRAIGWKWCSFPQAKRAFSPNGAQKNTQQQNSENMKKSPHSQESTSSCVTT